MAGTSGIRWPEELKAKIEKAKEEDNRVSFTDEVIYLVTLGLEEAEWQREIVRAAKTQRRSGERRAVSGE